ncbi:hypothetical protein NDN01_12060 [Sphingomonas sp. QA11]|uniref:hypothetical protein n=1 Tax=Sphingomonas sp. QA11 TaxID=2950605 RepID=UPI00234AC8E2|nr:hypothetical protein [Sphingomonas sp. QA11]WCM29565.1 hypothetical protein NDN01_12060 [Sphingomonas sp. QA11]
MSPDPTGLLVIALIGLALTSLALLCRLRTIRTPSRHPAPHPDITLGFRDPWR